MKSNEFLVNMKDWDDFEDLNDGKIVEAFDAEIAALEYAEDVWGVDPRDPSRVDYRIRVTDLNTKEVVEFEINAEATVNFYAYER